MEECGGINNRVVEEFSFRNRTAILTTIFMSYFPITTMWLLYAQISIVATSNSFKC
jgi:hypothetical protein